MKVNPGEADLRHFTGGENWYRVGALDDPRDDTPTFCRPRTMDKSSIATGAGNAYPENPAMMDHLERDARRTASISRPLLLWSG